MFITTAKLLKICLMQQKRSTYILGLIVFKIHSKVVNFTPIYLYLHTRARRQRIESQTSRFLHRFLMIHYNHRTKVYMTNLPLLPLSLLTVFLLSLSSFFLSLGGFCSLSLQFSFELPLLFQNLLDRDLQAFAYDFRLC